jgi:hypothetical protein
MLDHLVEIIFDCVSSLLPTPKFLNTPLRFFIACVILVSILVLFIAIVDLLHT